MILMLADADNRILNWGSPPWADTDTQPPHTLADIGAQPAPDADLRDYLYVAGIFIFSPLPPSVAEQDEADAGQARVDFRSLPNYATWTPAEAQANITGMVLGGQTLAQVSASIDGTNVTNAAQLRGLLKQLAGAVIDLRTVLALVGRMLMYLRVIVVRRE